MLISEPYRALQRQMHETTEYGVASQHFAKLVARVMNMYSITELLDYGAGSRLTLIHTINADKLVDHPFRYTPYEPAVEEYAAVPEPTEMVACLDVLEHIEPELIDNVLDDLARVTKRCGVFSVACVPAMKTLPDGRNAHLIQQPPEWWLPKLMERFELQTYQMNQEGFVILCTPKEFQ